MLVLSRKVGEAVHTDGITVRVLSISGNQVKLGFEGPGAVYREELRDRIPAAMPLRAEDLEEAMA